MTDPIREALEELVAVQDLGKSHAAAFAHWSKFQTDENLAVIDKLSTDLARRKPAAWTAARSALALPVEAGGWRPIAEAPKGRKVLAGYLNKLGNWRTITACFYPPHTLLLEDDRYEVDDEGYAPEGWYEESETQDSILPTDEPPTHFQFLPAPPADAQTQGEPT